MSCLYALFSIPSQEKQPSGNFIKKQSLLTTILANYHFLSNMS